MYCTHPPKAAPVAHAVLRRFRYDVFITTYETFKVGPPHPTPPHPAPPHPTLPQQASRALSSASTHKPVARGENKQTNKQTRACTRLARQ
jgi:hypothetical protein